MSDDVTAREAVERLARILRYDEDERQDRIEGGMMLVALLDRAERAEAERDAAFAAGQEDMRERAIQDVAEWGTLLMGNGDNVTVDVIDSIRALPLKPRP